MQDNSEIVKGYPYSIEGRAKEALDQHEQCVIAIENDDLVAAERAAREHNQGAHLARLPIMFEMNMADNKSRYLYSYKTAVPINCVFPAKNFWNELWRQNWDFYLFHYNIILLNDFNRGQTCHQETAKGGFII